MFSLIWLKICVSTYVLQTVLTSSGELFAFIECIQTYSKFILSNNLDFLTVTENQQLNLIIYYVSDHKINGIVGVSVKFFKSFLLIVDSIGKNEFVAMTVTM